MLVHAPAELCRATAEALAAAPPAPPILVGFDAFLDDIVDVVARRQGPGRYERVPTIADFGQKILAAAGHSAGIGAVKRLTKLGGNGPIMAGALLAQGAPLTLIGPLGQPLHPVFQPLAERARVISLGEPAVTTALEFADGKIMLNFSDPLDAVDEQRVLAACGGEAGFAALCREARAIATVNWSQLPAMDGIWRCLAGILRRLGHRPLLFVDLADPHRRPVEELRAGLALLGELASCAEVVLSTNGNECRQLCRAYDVAYPERAPAWEAARQACAQLRDRLGVARVACHLVDCSAEAGPDGSLGQPGFFEPQPLLTTGAGDHYNAGYLLGLLAGLPPAQRLTLGAATSACYVASGRSPARAELVSWLRQAADRSQAGPPAAGAAG
ncbi:MAG: carbohydrate kinase family protein [Planctomycetota bacterium]|nr:carbohydrate kinase family protein [Planctomycetota bacterium]MCX8040335.1 carbohydrate kinase family protein [Planctomycetota bacterium]MDW8373791.1 carbohydrate kinase family protein [Planctomycetota bacterium]